MHELLSLLSKIKNVVKEHWYTILKRSLSSTCNILASVVGTLLGILRLNGEAFLPSWNLYRCGLAYLAVGLIITLVTFCRHVYKLIGNKPYRTKINGKPVVIKTGNVFNEKGWRVIPFNERFDTQVDDIVIAHSSLNGQMIDNYVDDVGDLNNTISSASNSETGLKPSLENGNLVYPLGRLIEYKDFLMLAFSHFDEQNQAYLDIGDFEKMLFNMWKELRRVYAGKLISIPLLGAGITTFKEQGRKDNTEILRCILCTLRRSGFQPAQGLSIVIKKETMESIDMYMIKEEFSNGDL